jgi:hypothetical protein
LVQESFIGQPQQAVPFFLDLIVARIATNDRTAITNMVIIVAAFIGIGL